jgi:hypothetical protein
MEKSMSARSKPGRLKRAGLWAVAAAALVGGAAIAEQVVVKSKSVAIQPTPSGMGSAVETVATNTPLEVLEHKGTWLKVRTLSGKEGYVKEGALASQSFTTGTGTLRGDAASTGLNASLAGKGLEPEAKDFAKGRKADPAILEREFQRRDQITPEEFDQFLKQGQVGPYKGS